MIKFFVATFQHLELAAAVFTVLWALINILKSNAVRKTACYVLTAALAVSLVLAILKHNTRLINQEYVSIILLIPLCLVLVFLLGFTTRKLFNKAGSQDKPLPFSHICVITAFAAITLYTLPDYFIKPTDFVLSDVSWFSTEFLFAALGFAAATCLIFLSAVTMKAALLRLRQTLSLFIIISVVVIGIAFYGSTLVQLLLLRGFLPFNTFFFELVRITRNNQDAFAYACLAVFLITAVLLTAKNLPKVKDAQNPAQTRILKAKRRFGIRLGSLLAVLCIIGILNLSAIQAYSNRGFTLSPAESFMQTDTEARISLEQVSDSRLHRFAYTTPDGIEVRFIIIQKQGSSFGIGFDACEICGATGYYERDGQVICMLCDVVMNINTIGYRGGCNPIPLPYRIESGHIVIELVDLEVEKRRFR